MPQPVLVSRAIYVSLAHRYWASRCSAEENAARYGAQASAQGVGANMRIEVGRLRGNEEDLSRDLGLAKKLLDHRSLFSEIDEFRDRPSSLENIVQFLSTHLPDVDVLRVEESDKIACSRSKGQADIGFEMQVMNLRLYFKGSVGADGLLVVRDQVTQAVMNEYREVPADAPHDEAAWAERLLAQLALRVPLNQLRIDLGRQKYILVNSKG